MNNYAYVFLYIIIIHTNVYHILILNKVLHDQYCHDSIRILKQFMLTLKVDNIYILINYHYLNMDYFYILIQFYYDVKIFYFHLFMIFILVFKSYFSFYLF